MAARFPPAPRRSIVELSIVTGASPVFVAVVWMQRGPNSGPRGKNAQTERTVSRGRIATRRWEIDQMIVQASVSPETMSAIPATTAGQLRHGVGRIGPFGGKRDS
jgi:hypothetical protein